MRAKTRSLFGNTPLLAALSLLLLPLLYAGEAGAMYLRDGAKETARALASEAQQGYSLLETARAIATVGGSSELFKTAQAIATTVGDSGLLATVQAFATEKGLISG